MSQSQGIFSQFMHQNKGKFYLVRFFISGKIEFFHFLRSFHFTFPFICIGIFSKSAY